MNINKIVTRLKEEDQDFEFYPTTDHMIDKINQDLQYGSILDIGCGNGNLKKLMNKDIAYLGVDSNAGIYKPKKSKYIKYFKNSKKTEEYINKLKKFDCIALMDVLEHTDNFIDLFNIALKK